MSKIRRAHIGGEGTAIVCYVLLALIISWFIRHILIFVSQDTLSENSLNIFWLISFLSLTYANIVALLDTRKTADNATIQNLNELNVAVLIPVYNEDDNLLKACIESILRQTRKPNKIFVVDDGSIEDYGEVKRWLSKRNHCSIDIEWRKTTNMGKRHAQSLGISKSQNADIYITVDSDTILDPRAIYEGLLPFSDPKVQSVAGIYLPLNVNENLLTRMTGLWETMWQLVDRSAQSAFKCVTVNSGTLAFYRAKIIRKHLLGYLNETFFGRVVNLSDDSLMTTYCLLGGKTVQQATSIGFSASPNKYYHHLVRYTRWMRGSFIRTWWRFRYLQLNSYIYWLHLYNWIRFSLSTVVFIYLITYGYFQDKQFLIYALLAFIFISYLQAIRYFTIKRNDEKFKDQLITFLTAPLGMFWIMTVLRMVKLYAYLTCLKTGWGTRKVVEVSIPESK